MPCVEVELVATDDLLFVVGFAVTGFSFSCSSVFESKISSFATVEVKDAVCGRFSDLEEISALVTEEVDDTLLTIEDGGKGRTLGKIERIGLEIDPLEAASSLGPGHSFDGFGLDTANFDEVFGLPVVDFVGNFGLSAAVFDDSFGLPATDSDEVIEITAAPSHRTVAVSFDEDFEINVASMHEGAATVVMLAITQQDFFSMSTPETSSSRTLSSPAEARVRCLRGRESGVSLLVLVDFKRSAF